MGVLLLCGFSHLSEATGRHPFSATQSAPGHPRDTTCSQENNPETRWRCFSTASTLDSLEERKREGSRNSPSELATRNWGGGNRTWPEGLFGWKLLELSDLPVRTRCQKKRQLLLGSVLTLSQRQRRGLEGLWVDSGCETSCISTHSRAAGQWDKQ